MIFTHRRGFTLMELLIVIALLCLLMVLLVPAFTSIAQGGGMKRAIGAASDALEVARTDAMSTSTWVLVGFADTTAQNPGKISQLTIFTMGSRDGTTNMAANNLRPLYRPVHIDNVKLLSSPSKWADGATVLKGSPFAFTATNNNTTVNVSDTIVAFSPRGEAIINPAAMNSWIELPLREMRGTQEVEEKTASVRVSGMSGQVMVSY